MAGRRTGTSTVIWAARKICKMANLGLYDLEQRTTVGFKTAVYALIAACQAFEALDDHPGEFDRTSPYGPEDVPNPDP